METCGHDQAGEDNLAHVLAYWILMKMVIWLKTSPVGSTFSRKFMEKEFVEFQTSAAMYLMYFFHVVWFRWRVVKRYAKGLLDRQTWDVRFSRNAGKTILRSVTSKKSEEIQIISFVHIVLLGHNRGWSLNPMICFLRTGLRILTGVQVGG